MNTHLDTIIAILCFLKKYCEVSEGLKTYMDPARYLHSDHNQGPNMLFYKTNTFEKFSNFQT